MKCVAVDGLGRRPSRWFARLTLWSMTLALLVSGAALAAEPPVSQGTTRFGEARPIEVDLPEPGPDASCDDKLRYVAAAADVCVANLKVEKRNGVGLPFLRWAYLVVWVILLVFFISTRLKQRRLEAEMRELRARLAVMSGESS